jgi:hypothetical protein
MARAPRWHCDLSPVASWLAAFGLPTAWRPPGAPLSTTAWRQLRSTAAHHRLEGLLVGAVAAGALPVTDAQASEVAALEVALTTRRILQDTALVEVAGRLAEEGIELRLLKGTALARLDYPDPMLRPTGDLDLLVTGEDLPRAVATLEALGGTRIDPEPWPGYDRLVSKAVAVAAFEGRVEIDLHRVLISGPYGARLPADDLWRAARPVVVAGRLFATLPVEESLLSAAFHLLVEGFRRALSLRDVAQLAGSPDLDPGRTLALARRWRAEAPLAVALAMARRDLALAGADPLQRWAERFRVGPRDRLWLRAQRPEQTWYWTRAAATVVELPAGPQRRVLVRSLLRPREGTWPPLHRRLARKTRKLLARVRSRPAR